MAIMQGMTGMANAFSDYRQQRHEIEMAKIQKRNDDAAAVEAAADAYGQLNKRADQLKQETAEANMDAQKRRMKAVGAAKVAAAAAGVTSNSVDTVVTAIYREEADVISKNNQTNEIGNDNLRQQGKAVQADVTRQLRSGVVTGQASGGAAAVRALSAGMNSYVNYKMWDANRYDKATT